MISFKHFLSESKNDIGALHAEIKEHIKNGEIVKPRFADLKYDVEKELNRDKGSLDHHWYGQGNALDKIDPALGELVYKLPSGVHELKSLGTFLKKHNVKHPFWSDTVAFHKKWEPIYNDMQTLKGMVVTTAAKRAEKKEVEAKVQQKRFTDAKSLTGTLMKHKDEFVDQAGKRGGEFWQRHMDALKKAGGLDKIAPTPSWRTMSSDSFKAARAKRQFYMEIQKGSLEQYAKMYADAAHEDYMAWIHKLTAKIGKPVASSTMTGSPWKGSTINVTCTDGEKQTWHTQMIINHSKYGKPFNQFPTRRQK